MNNAIVPPIKRRRGRPRKKNANVPAINKFPTFTPQTSYSPAKRKAAGSPDIEIIALNGDIPKKPKLDDPTSDQPKRLQPPRRARFTESYGGNTDVVMVSASDDDSESGSDSECSPIPSPVPKIRSKVEQEEYDANIEKLKKALGDEEMKLVLLRKLRESQKSKRGESNSSPLPTTPLVSSSQKPVMLKGGVQIQPLPSKQLITSNKYLTSKRDGKQDAISNSNSLLKQSSSTQFKPIQPLFKPHQQPYKPIKQEAHQASTASSTISSSSVEQLNSNHLNQYPLLKNLSNQITITAVPPSTSSSNGSNRHQQQQQQQQQEEKNDAETLQQRQAAAKLALRKQLEKTLLQIPLPKPPPLKINFYPAPNSMEFLCLMGLDFVVDFLTKKGSTPNKDPLRCAQCSTDFTCAWKWKEVDKNGKKAYDAFCEACITSNIRKGLKAQHTNNLKSAFLKALQQEKEIDRLTIHTLPKLPPPKLPPQPREAPKSSHSRHNRHASEATSSGRQPSPAHQGLSTSAFSIPKAGMALPYIPTKGQQGINHAALAQLSKLSPQYQSLLQAQAQQLLAAGVPLHPGVLSLSPFMTPVPNHHGRGKSSGDGRSRHYRSDRVQSPNVPPHTSSSSWKT